MRLWKAMWGIGAPQPHPLTSVMQLSLTACALAIGASALIFALRSSSDERNARLVELGLRVLMVDPAKAESLRPARAWALDLIDANAGVKFSKEARATLLEKPLPDFGTANYAPNHQMGFQPDALGTKATK